MNSKLRTVCDRVNQWCRRAGVRYDIVCDENDLQGLLLFRHDASRAPKLLDYLRPTLEAENVYARSHQVRAGVVLAFSLRALAESELARITGDRAVKPDFPMKLDGAFAGTIIQPRPVPPPEDIRRALLGSARAMRESQYHYPTRIRDKSKATNRFPDSNQPEQEPPLREPGPIHTRGRKRFKTAPRVPGILSRDDFRKSERLESLQDRIGAILSELDQAAGALPMPGGSPGLQGMGAEQQPGDLFSRFAAALKQLGTQMNIGPLQDKLKQQGIKWKKSEDGQALIFFVINGETRAPQPVARIGSETLAKPQDFQKALSQMLDFAEGQAPGTGEQKQLEVQEKQKRLREIATQLAPQDPSKAQAMQQQPAQPMPAPAPKPDKPVAREPQPQNPKVSRLAAHARAPGPKALGPGK